MQHPQAMQPLFRAGFFVAQHFFDGPNGGLAVAVYELIHRQHADGCFHQPCGGQNPVAPAGSVIASQQRLNQVDRFRGDNYAVSVFPFIEGASHSITDLERPRLLEAVGRLHVCTDAVLADLPRRDSLTVPIRSARRLLRDNQSVFEGPVASVRRAGGRGPWRRGGMGDHARSVAHRECAAGQQWRAHTDRLGLCGPGTARARLGQALGWVG